MRVIFIGESFTKSASRKLCHAPLLSGIKQAIFTRSKIINERKELFMKTEAICIKIPAKDNYL